MEWNVVQILVVVANIQVKYLKVEVEKGSMWTLFGHGLIGSNIFRYCYEYRKRFCLLLQYYYMFWQQIYNDLVQSLVDKRCLFLLK